jgi:hypothetical protein
VFALQCTECGRRRDPRVTFCPSCGGTEGIEDQTSPIPPGGHHFDAGQVSIGVPQTSERARERMIALRQQQALLEGRNPPDPALLGSAFDYEQEMRKAELEARGAEIMRDTFSNGPGTSGRWEANPFGVSGRLIRGYRHWRNKR